MERLSINDLNNLSGVSSNELDELYKNFRSAHTSLYNKMNKLINYISSVSNTSNKLSDSDNYRVYKDLYYKCTLANLDMDLFRDNTKDYVSLLDKLNLNSKIGEVDKLFNLVGMKHKELNKLFTDIIDKYNYYYSRLEEMNEG